MKDLKKMLAFVLWTLTAIAFGAIETLKWQQAGANTVIVDFVIMAILVTIIGYLLSLRKAGGIGKQ